MFPVIKLFMATNKVLIYSFQTQMGCSSVYGIKKKKVSGELGKP